MDGSVDHLGAGTCTALGEGCQTGTLASCSTCWDGTNSVTSGDVCVCTGAGYTDVDAGTGNGNLDCQSCTPTSIHGDCSSCSGPSTCTGCNSGFYLANPTTCSTLGEGCATGASGNTSPTCATCHDGTNAQTNALVCECKAGFFDVNTGTTNGDLDCQPLGQGCDERTAGDACTSCLDAQTDASDTGSSCTCNTGFYDSDSGTGYNQLSCSTCSSAMTNCDVCSDATTCSQCAAGFYRDTTGSCAS